MVISSCSPPRFTLSLFLLFFVLYFLISVHTSHARPTVVVPRPSSFLRRRSDPAVTDVCPPDDGVEDVDDADGIDESLLDMEPDSEDPTDVDPCDSTDATDGYATNTPLNTTTTNSTSGFNATAFLNMVDSSGHDSGDVQVQQTNNNTVLTLSNAFSSGDTVSIQAGTPCSPKTYSTLHWCDWCYDTMSDAVAQFKAANVTAHDAITMIYGSDIGAAEKWGVKIVELVSAPVDSYGDTVVARVRFTALSGNYLTWTNVSTTIGSGAHYTTCEDIIETPNSIWELAIIPCAGSPTMSLYNIRTPTQPPLYLVSPDDLKTSTFPNVNTAVTVPRNQADYLTSYLFQKQTAIDFAALQPFITLVGRTTSFNNYGKVSFTTRGLPLDGSTSSPTSIRLAWNTGSTGNGTVYGRSIASGDQTAKSDETWVADFIGNPSLGVLQLKTTDGQFLGLSCATDYKFKLYQALEVASDAVAAKATTFTLAYCIVAFQDCWTLSPGLECTGTLQPTYIYTTDLDNGTAMKLDAAYIVIKPA